MADLVQFRLSVQTDPLADGLLRILGLVAVQPVRLVSVGHRQTEAGGVTALEIDALSPQKARLLAARLGELAWVREVALVSLTASKGWAAERQRDPTI
jgi:acetolactate synthase regulatory subunit